MSASDILSVIAPQFNDSDNRSGFLNIAASLVSSSWFGNKYDLAVAYLTAHMMSLSNDPLRQSGETGSVSSKKEGDLAIAFSNGSISEQNAYYGLTHFGMQYIQTRDSCGFILGVTGGAVR
jgi:hypothetical protein